MYLEAVNSLLALNDYVGISPPDQSVHCRLWNGYEYHGSLKAFDRYWLYPSPVA